MAKKPIIKYEAHEYNGGETLPAGQVAKNRNQGGGDHVPIEHESSLILNIFSTVEIAVSENLDK